jgi:signal peptidase I
VVKTIWDWTKQLGIALILALMLKTSIVEAYKIPSGSMEKTLLVGDFLLANKFIYGMRLPIPWVDIKLPAIKDPKPGDVIIFKYPGNPEIGRKDKGPNYIKRCIAVEGQKVRIEDKQVFVDGKAVPLPEFGQFRDDRIFPFYNNHQGRRDNIPEFVVPEGKLFMMGDNRDNSSDSRVWGFLNREDVLGKAMVIHWSWHPFLEKGDNHYNETTKHPEDIAPPPDISKTNPLSIVELVAYNIYHFPERVRWSRIGDVIE